MALMVETVSRMFPHLPGQGGKCNRLLRRSACMSAVPSSCRAPAASAPAGLAYLTLIQHRSQVRCLSCLFQACTRTASEPCMSFQRPQSRHAQATAHDLPFEQSRRTKATIAGYLHSRWAQAQNSAAAMPRRHLSGISLISQDCTTSKARPVAVAKVDNPPAGRL